MSLIRNFYPVLLVLTLTACPIGGFVGPTPGSTPRPTAAPPEAVFSRPVAIALEADGSLLIADYGYEQIRRLRPDGKVSILAGGLPGERDGTGTAAGFNGLNGLAVTPDGTVYVSAGANYRIRKVTASGVVTAFAGAGHPGYSDGQGLTAIFDQPAGITLDTAGNLYVADRGNGAIRKITPAGQVSTLTRGFRFSADGLPIGLAVNAAGELFVSDRANHRIARLSPSGQISTFADDPVSFRGPAGLALDAAQNLYVADASGYAIRKISPDSTVSTLAGGQRGSDDGSGSAARFNLPTGVAVDASGHVYVADQWNQRIRKISPEGVVTTLPQAGPAGPL